MLRLATLVTWETIVNGSKGFRRPRQSRIEADHTDLESMTPSLTSTDLGIPYVVSKAFQKDAEQYFHKWDKEWIRYFYVHDDNVYFKDFSGESYQLSLSTSEVADFDVDQTLLTRLIPDERWTKLQIYVPGSTFVGKDVFEIGCGVGMAGRLIGKLARSYVGFDYSRLALDLARLTSPSTCSYIHVSDREAIEDLYGTADLCFGRHFFIHQNFENATWVLSFLRDVVKEDGLIHADFFRADEPSTNVYPAKTSLQDRASSGFFFTRREIEELAELCDLRIEEVNEIDQPPRVYVNFRRR